MSHIKSNIEIAQGAKLRHIRDVAADAGIPEAYVEPYGGYKAKINLGFMRELEGRPDGKLVLVTAISPTPAGEGKTTTTVGLGDALSRLGHKTIITLREPSLGPVFGSKGGATGGGYAQVAPMEDINLHFTGDMHAIGAANNLLAALIDNHIHQGNALDIDTRRIFWRRCVDMNDRQLRAIVSGLGGKTNGTPREDGFDITAASEVMAIFCLAENIGDLKRRLSDIIVALDRQGSPVRAGQLGAEGAMAALLRDAINPNLVQTLEHTPALIHGGPFANIAHGCNSLIADKMALKLAGYVVTEAGFGSDLGAEKFFDIKCRRGGLRPAAAVIVATLRALKSHGGAKKDEWNDPDPELLKKGMPNLLRHVDNVTVKFGVPAVVAINRFPGDTEDELELVRGMCADKGINAVVSEVWENGGRGGEALAREVVRLSQTDGNFRPLYDLELPLAEKISVIAREVYGADGVELLPAALKEIKQLEDMGLGNLPVCMAKTQVSFSDDPAKLGAPSGFHITVRSVRASAGAGFVVALTGDIMTMPPLLKKPSAERIDVDENGRITGLS